jgi:Uma2 family endonuclease
MKTPEVAVEILAEIPLFPSSKVGPYRRDDYLALPDEPRCELLYGRFYLVAPPRPLHQIVGLLLWRWLDDIALACGGQALAAPVGITLADHSVVEPDVVYLARRATPEEIRGEIAGVPDLLVEVLSPGSVRRDRGLKLRLYADAGVPEYWIVAPTERHVDFLVNRGGRFELVVPEGNLYRSPALSGVTLDLADLWRQVDLRTALPAAS